VSYFLDANICIYALKGTYPSIERGLRGRSPQDIKIASIVKAELLYGVEKSDDPKKTLGVLEAFLFPFQVIPFCDTAARHYAIIRHELEKKGHPIGPNDLIIAAIVLARSGTLVTHNVREFGRIKGLRLEDWTK
jgi:tRNA(fMet)-specific endonuclease VapC